MADANQRSGHARIGGMPEGDTVFNHARALQDALAGQTIVRSDFRVPKLATTDLAGWTVVESAARGKHLLLRLADPAGATATLHSHLRMDGSWRTFRRGERWHGGPAHTIRIVLDTDKVTAVGYHLHDIALVPTDDEHTLVDHLGPGSPRPGLGRRARRSRTCRAAPERAIADALLDQRNLAGIGNMYKSEVLFLRGVWPWRPVGDVADLAGLVSARAADDRRPPRPVDPVDHRIAAARRGVLRVRPGRPPVPPLPDADPPRRRGRLRPRHVLVPVLPARADARPRSAAASQRDQPLASRAGEFGQRLGHAAQLVRCLGEPALGDRFAEQAVLGDDTAPPPSRTPRTRRHRR